MPDRFHNALRLTFGFEGGISNDPADKGGLTNLGITQATWDSYCHEKGLPHSSVAGIGRGTAVAVYQALFWDAAHAGACKEPLSALVFDYAVNSGPGRAVKDLQRTLGVTADGQVGVHTISALTRAETRDLKALCTAYLARREAFLRDIAHGDQARFLHGWLHRVETLRGYVGEVLG